MSSWKYAGSYASLKGNFSYSYFLKGDVKAFLGTELSLRGMWWYPAQRLRVKTYWAPLSLEKISDFWHGPDKLLDDFVQGSVVDDGAFSTITLGTMVIGAGQLEWLLYMTFASKSLLISFFTQSVLHGNRVMPLWDRLRGTCVNLHFSKCVLLILVSSCENWDLNVSNNLSSDCFISLKRLCKGGWKCPVELVHQLFSVWLYC